MNRKAEEKNMDRPVHFNDSIMKYMDFMKMDRKRCVLVDLAGGMLAMEIDKVNEELVKITDTKIKSDRDIIARADEGLLVRAMMDIVLKKYQSLDIVKDYLKKVSGEDDDIHEIFKYVCDTYKFKKEEAEMLKTDPEIVKLVADCYVKTNEKFGYEDRPLSRCKIELLFSAISKECLRKPTNPLNRMLVNILVERNWEEGGDPKDMMITSHLKREIEIVKRNMEAFVYYKDTKIPHPEFMKMDRNRCVIVLYDTYFVAMDIDTVQKRCHAVGLTNMTLDPNADIALGKGGFMDTVFSDMIAKAEKDLKKAGPEKTEEVKVIDPKEMEKAEKKKERNKKTRENKKMKKIKEAEEKEALL